jgi:hypothetical protein
MAHAAPLASVHPFLVGAGVRAEQSIGHRADRGYDVSIRTKLTLRPMSKQDNKSTCGLRLYHGGQLEASLNEPRPVVAPGGHDQLYSLY